MPDLKYCYKDSDVLRNKLDIRDEKRLFMAEVRLTSLRLQELEEKPIIGDFDLRHLQAIHRYIFQDIYEWAGEIRTVEIGKGNCFCPSKFIDSYAETVFSKYYSECWTAKDDIEKFIRVLASNYGDLNALHPFREGNGRAQREFARTLCQQCGYDFRLNNTTHNDMLNASKLSFDKGDNSKLERIFKEAIRPNDLEDVQNTQLLSILTSDDLTIPDELGYDYYTDTNDFRYELYSALFEAKLQKMKAENRIRQIQDSIDKISDGE